MLIKNRHQTNTFGLTFAKNPTHKDGHLTKIQHKWPDILDKNTTHMA